MPKNEVDRGAVKDRDETPLLYPEHVPDELGDPTPDGQLPRNEEYDSSLPGKPVEEARAEEKEEKKEVKSQSAKTSTKR